MGGPTTMPETTWVEVARKLIHPRLAERHDTFRDELDAHQNLCNAKGLLRSGAYVKGLARLASNELKIRVGMVTATLLRVIQRVAAGPDENLEQGIIVEMRIHAKEADSAIRGEVN